MVGVQKLFRFFAERLAQIVAIECLHLGVFVAEAQKRCLIQLIQALAALARQLLIFAADGLAAAARTAAGAGHHFHKVILRLAALDAV